MILHVAAREHTGDAGLRAVVRDDVAGGVHVDLAAEYLRVRGVTDRDKYTRHTQLPHLAGDVVSQHDASHLALLEVSDGLDLAVPRPHNLGVGQGFVPHDLRRAQRGAPMDDGHFTGELGEKQRFFHRRIAAAHDGDFLAAEEVAVTSRARGEPVADQPALAGQPQHARRGAGGDDQGAGLIFSLGGLDPERRFSQVDAGDMAVNKLRSETLGLRAHLGHEIGTHDAVAVPRPVLNEGRQHELPAGFEAFDDKRLQVAPRRIQCRRQTRGTRPDDDDVTRSHFRGACRSLS